jgi:hypothetical protein
VRACSSLRVGTSGAGACSPLGIRTCAAAGTYAGTSTAVSTAKQSMHVNSARLCACACAFVRVRLNMC